MINVINENQVKDFKKLGKLVSIAKGYRTIGGFSADCRLNVEFIADLINVRIKIYPSIEQLQIIADHSEGRVSLKDLKLACGYSLYENNDREEIKNIQVRRGWFCYANYGEKSIDSEIGGIRTVLVIQNDKGNIFSPNTIVIPTTTRKTKSKLPTHVFIEKKYGLKDDSVICCELVGTLSKRRLLFRGGIEKVCECPQEILEQVGVALNKAMGVINLDVNEQEAIEDLIELNSHRKFQYENNYNQNYEFEANRQVAFA